MDSSLKSNAFADTEYVPVVVVCGPTAVGKTDFLRFLHDIPVEVISADTRQIYRGFSIATAYPPENILSQIPHHLINELSFTEPYTVADFVLRTKNLICEIWQRGNYPLVVGGAAYYLYHLWYGMPQTPNIDMYVRTHIRHLYANEGITSMYQRLRQCDAAYADAIADNDTHRILRALEVYQQTRIPLSMFRSSDYKNKMSTVRPHNWQMIGFTRTRNVLYHRIHQRVDAMITRGLVHEIHTLWKQGLSCVYNAARTIGVQEFLMNTTFIHSWSNNQDTDRRTLEEIIALIKQNSRKYAKRQCTFFRKFSDVTWIDLGEKTAYVQAYEQMMRHYERFGI